MLLVSAPRSRSKNFPVFSDLCIDLVSTFAREVKLVKLDFARGKGKKVIYCYGLCCPLRRDRLRYLSGSVNVIYCDFNNSDLYNVLSMLLLAFVDGH